MSQYLPFVLALLPWAGWGFALGLAYVWLRHALTPMWLLGLFESEGEPSVRLVLAPLMVVFTLCMEAAGRISDGLVQANYLLAGTLLGLGTAKLVGKAFAGRPAALAANIHADKAKLRIDGDANFSGPTPPEQP